MGVSEEKGKEDIVVFAISLEAAREGIGGGRHDAFIFWECERMGMKGRGGVSYSL